MVVGIKFAIPITAEPSPRRVSSEISSSQPHCHVDPAGIAGAHLHQTATARRTETAL